jgi:hypothetical protein
VKPVNMMLVELLYEREIPVQDLHNRLKEAGHNHTSEYLCRSILGARDLKADLIRHIIEVLDLETEGLETARELCRAHFMRGEPIRRASC